MKFEELVFWIVEHVLSQLKNVGEEIILIATKKKEYENLPGYSKPATRTQGMAQSGNYNSQLQWLAGHNRMSEKCAEK